MHAVAAFAKQTGDFAALSLTDLKIIALAYTFEHDIHGMKYLRSEPRVSFSDLNKCVATLQIPILRTIYIQLGDSGSTGKFRKSTRDIIDTETAVADAKAYEDSHGDDANRLPECLAEEDNLASIESDDDDDDNSTAENYFDGELLSS